MKYPITPVAKPRMTQRDKWKKPPRSCVARYRAFADECRLRIGAIDLNYAAITFGIPMPKSWSKRKQFEMRGKPHTPKPDLSNLLKSIEDALYSKKFTGRAEDDSSIHSLGTLRKIWWHEGAIWIDE